MSQAALGPVPCGLAGAPWPRALWLAAGGSKLEMCQELKEVDLTPWVL